MSLVTDIVSHPEIRYKLPRAIEEKLDNFSNQSLARNTDTKKFPMIQNTRAKIASKLRNRKMIHRVPYYTEKRRAKLQISETREEFSKKMNELEIDETQEISHNLDETPIMQEFTGLQEVEYFNQWFTANNFDILRFNETYDTITIDEDEPRINIEEMKIDVCDVDFTFINDMWKYINDIQKTGKWTIPEKLRNMIQNFFKQYNIDVFREIMKKQWYEARKTTLKYFFETKRLLLKMQNESNEKEVRQELENFKKEGIEIINPAKKAKKDLKRYLEVRKMPNYEISYEEIHKKLSEICDQCFKNWYLNIGIFRKQCPRQNKEKYMPIRFMEPRMITTPRYFEIKNILREKEIEKTRKKEIAKDEVKKSAAEKRWLYEQVRIILKLAEAKMEEVKIQYEKYVREIRVRDRRLATNQIEEIWRRKMIYDKKIPPKEEDERSNLFQKFIRWKQKRKEEKENVWKEIPKGKKKRIE
jgi:hypothetical protein